MKKLICIALLFSTMHVVSSTDTAGVPKVPPKKDVHIAIRTDGALGSGTKIDPFDGSTSAKLDALLRGLANNTTVHFGRGTFHTDGFQNCSGHLGFTVKPGCKYRGSGRDITIIQLMTAVGGNGSSHQGIVFSADNADVTGASIRDLTVDCNGEALVTANNSDFKTYAAALSGSNCTISNVHVIHVYGHEATGAEAFAIGIQSPESAGHNIPATGALIERCLVDDFAAGSDHGQMICLSGGDSTLSGAIKDCVVVGQTTNTSAYQLYGSRAQMENDVSINCKNFLYMDTGNLDHVLIQNCRGTGVTGNFINFSPAAGFTHRDITIQNCAADFAAPGVFLYADATRAGASISNIHLINNTATQSAGVHYAPLNLAKVTGFHASHNHWHGAHP